MTAADGLRVQMYSLWYQEHIWHRKPEIRWLSDPISAIAVALERAVRIDLQANGRLLYVGPELTGGFLAGQSMRVAVQSRGGTGTVFTAILAAR